jgi:predicted nucleotidyltransferase
MRVEPDAIGLSSADVATLSRILGRYAQRIDRVSVYGSRAAGLDRDGSDLDLLLDGPIDLAEMLNLGVALEESDLAVAVDLQHQRDLGSASVRDEILKRCRLLYTRDDLLKANA